MPRLARSLLLAAAAAVAAQATDPAALVAEARAAVQDVRAATKSVLEAAKADCVSATTALAATAAAAGNKRDEQDVLREQAAAQQAVALADADHLASELAAQRADRSDALAAQHAETSRLSADAAAHAHMADVLDMLLWQLSGGWAAPPAAVLAQVRGLRGLTSAQLSQVARASQSPGSFDELVGVLRAISDNARSEAKEAAAAKTKAAEQLGGVATALALRVGQIEGDIVSVNDRARNKAAALTRLRAMRGAFNQLYSLAGQAAAQGGNACATVDKVIHAVQVDADKLVGILDQAAALAPATAAALVTRASKASRSMALLRGTPSRASRRQQSLAAIFSAPGEAKAAVLQSTLGEHTSTALQRVVEMLRTSQRTAAQADRLLAAVDSQLSERAATLPPAPCDARAAAVAKMNAAQASLRAARDAVTDSGAVMMASRKAADEMKAAAPAQFQALVTSGMSVAAALVDFARALADADPLVDSQLQQAEQLASTMTTTTTTAGTALLQGWVDFGHKAAQARSFWKIAVDDATAAATSAQQQASNAISAVSGNLLPRLMGAISRAETAADPSTLGNLERAVAAAEEQHAMAKGELDDATAACDAAIAPVSSDDNLVWAELKAVRAAQNT